MKNIKSLFLTVLLILGGFSASQACSPLNVPTLISQSIVGSNLVLNWQSSTPYHCPDVIDVEIACNSMPFSGLAAYTYTSSVVTGASTPYTYPAMNINIASLCPGTVYKFRARERNNGGVTASGWTANFTFTTPGTFVTPTGTITANPPVITACPVGSSTLIPTFSNACGNPATFGYTWTPSTGLSCVNCFSPVASPAATTIYTLLSNGGQLGCWNMTNTVQVTVITTPPSVGTASIAPTTMCAGNSATVSINTYSGALQWQSATSSTGPFTNVAGATSSTYNTGPLSNSMCYRAAITGCGGTIYSNTVCVTVNPNPTVTVAGTGTICAGQTANFTANGASSYAWSAGAVSTGVNTATASPASTTSYTVTGTSAGCTGTAAITVVVNPMPVPSANNNGPVCTGGSLVLTAGGGGTYQWSGPNSFNSTLQSPNINPVANADAGVYTVTVNLSGCTAVASTTVAVFTPTASASNTGPYCTGSTIQLVGSAGAGYTWSGPNSYSSSSPSATTTIPNANTSMSGVYTVVVNLGSCTATGTTAVTVYALPTVTAQSNGPVCAGQPLNLTGSSASTYTWSGPGGFTSNAQTTGIAIASSTNSGIYTYSVTDINGCVNGTSIPVTVNALPIVTVNSPSACAGQNINLAATGGTAYAWSGPAAYTSSVQNPVITNATTGMSGAYTVLVTDVNSCTNTAVGNVTVIPLPVPTANNNGPLCVKATLSLSASGGTGYAWVGPSHSSTVQNPVITNVTTANAGVYTVTVSANGCSATAQTTVIINPLPVPVASNNSPVCAGAALNFTAAGGGSYSWSGPGGFSSSLTNPSISSAAAGNSGTYTLTVIDGNNCVESATVSALVNPLPTATATGTSVCENFPATIGANGGVNYSWTGPGGYTSSAQNPNFPSAQLSSNGQYTVLVTDANSCTNTAVANLSVTPAPVANIQSNSPICIFNTLNLSGSGGVSYSWSGPNGFTSTQQNPSLAANTTAYSGNYILTVTDANNCVAITSASVVINPKPTLTILSSNNKGCIPLCVTYTMQSSASVQNVNWTLGNGTYSNLQTTQSCYGASGVYTINATVTDVNNCTNSSTYTVQVYPQPVADFNYAPLKPIEGVDEVQFTDASHGAPITSWNWYFTNTPGQNTSTTQNPSFTYMEAGEYVAALIVKSDKGCTDTLIKQVSVGEDFGVYVPNAFTPNGDGINDVFQPKGFGIVKFEMQIFDRWGEKIFESNDIEKGWDGIRQKKNDVNYTVGKEDIYTWRIKVTSVFGKAHEYTGHVTLIK